MRQEVLAHSVWQRVRSRRCQTSNPKEDSVKDDWYFRQLDQAHERALAQRDEAREKLKAWREAQSTRSDRDYARGAEDEQRKQDAKEGF